MELSPRTVSLFAILFFAIQLGNASKLIAEGTIQCHINDTFCFYIGFFESDPWSKDERLDSRGILCTHSDHYDYKLTGHEDGDGLNNDFYELDIYIRHNCTDGGFIYQVAYKPPMQSVSIPEIVIKYDPEITNKGEKVSYYKFDE